MEFLEAGLVAALAQGRPLVVAYVIRGCHVRICGKIRSVLCFFLLGASVGLFCLGNGVLMATYLSFSSINLALLKKSLNHFVEFYPEFCEVATYTLC